MDDRLHKKLLRDTDELRSILADCSTESIIGTVAVLLLKWPDENIGLLSPQRQLAFMLGLMLTTDIPTQPKDFSKKLWERAKVLLERIFSSYGWMYWPSENDNESKDAHWKKIRDVAMPAFLQYFNSGLIASTTQVIDRINRYLLPFNDIIKESYRISILEMLDITAFIAKRVQESYQRLGETQKKEELLRHQLLDKTNKNKWGKNEISAEAQKNPYKDAMYSYLGAIDDLFKVTHDEIAENFNTELANAFCELFVANREDEYNYTYLTEDNPADNKPIFYLSNHTIFIPCVHLIYLAILNVIDNNLNNSKYKHKFLKHRDNALQAETIEILSSFFNDKATIFSSVYENKNLQNEHDIIIQWNRIIFVMEVKASPPVEPFRDPEKAFIRIKRRFASDRGIQKAYEQAHRIELAYSLNENIQLFNEKRDFLLEINKSNTDKIYCICVTRDNFGMLATDLSLLLGKDIEYSYPWAVNILDLESIFDAMEYFEWGPDRLCEYLDARERMHGKIAASDELEYLGYLIEHGNYDAMFNHNKDLFILDPSYSNIFTKIHHAKLGGEPVEYSPHPPSIIDIKSELRKRFQDIGNYSNKPTYQKTDAKQGRNDPCACGSGKKYKFCCGKYE